MPEQIARGDAAASDVLAAVDLALAPFRGAQAGQAQHPEQLAMVLAADPGYRVLRRLHPLPPAPVETLSGAVCVAFLEVVDDPLAPQRDRVADLAVAVVQVTSEGGVVRGLVDSFASHGRSDLDRFDRAMRRVALVVAHGAAEVRPLLESRFPWLGMLRWACSRQEVRWRGTDVVELQCMRLGYFYESGKTLQRAHALAALCCAGGLAPGQGGGDRTVLQGLIASSKRSSLRLVCVPDAHAATDDTVTQALVNAGFSWEQDEGAYVANLGASEDEAQLRRRVADIAGWSGRLELQQVDGVTRWSTRAAFREPGQITEMGVR